MIGDGYTNTGTCTMPGCMPHYAPTREPFHNYNDNIIHHTNQENSNYTMKLINKCHINTALHKMVNVVWKQKERDYNYIAVMLNTTH